MENFRALSDGERTTILRALEIYETFFELHAHMQTLKRIQALRAELEGVRILIG